MRDTKALQAARDSEPDPYKRRFPFSKWTRTVTVLDVPQLFKRLPEFSAWKPVDHERTARQYLAQLLADEQVYRDILTRYEKQFGDSGPLISGGFRDNWPDYAKDACRFFAHRLTQFSDISHAHWRAAGKHSQTWRELLTRCRVQDKSPMELT